MGEGLKQKIYTESHIRDAEGQKVSFHASQGLPTSIDVVGSPSDYLFCPTEYPNGVFIKPLVSGTIKVLLIGQDEKLGEYYLFEAEEIDANIGIELNARIRKIYKAGTTVTRIKAVW